MKQLSDKELDKRLKSKLGNQHADPPEDAWEAIEQELRPPAGGKKTGRIVLLKRISLYAAVLAGILMVAVGIWLLKKPSGTSISGEELVREEASGSTTGSEERPEEQGTGRKALAQTTDTVKAPVPETMPGEEDRPLRENEILAAGDQVQHPPVPSQAEQSRALARAPRRAVHRNGVSPATSRIPPSGVATPTGLTPQHGHAIAMLQGDAENAIWQDEPAAEPVKPVITSIQSRALPVTRQQGLAPVYPQLKEPASVRSGRPGQITAVEKKKPVKINDLADVVNTLAYLDPREQKFISIEKDRETEKVKTFRLDLGEIAITYNPSNKNKN